MPLPTHSAGALAPLNTDQSATPVASPTHADGDLDGLPVNHDDADTFQTTAMQATPNADGTSLEESAINKEAINGDHDLNENSQGIDPETEALMVRQGAAVQLLKLRDLSHLMICEVEKHTPNQNSNDDAVLDLTTQQKQQQPADTVNENMPLDLTPENTQQVSEETENKQNGEAENVEKQTENGHTENKTENQDTSKADVPDSDELKELIKQENKIVARKGRKSKKRKFVQGSDDEDFERPHIPDAVVDEDDGTYLSLKVPALELLDGAVVGEVSLSSDLKNLSTTELRKEVNRLRKELNKTGDDFVAAHRQCTQYRDKYASIAIRHAEITQHIHIREALKVSGNLNRPLTDEEKAKVEGLKLRSGKKLAIKRPKTDEEIQDENFNFTAFSMMQDFKKNMRSQKVHTKQTLCIMQQYTERCAVCSKFFRTKDGLRSHLVAHTKSFYRCPLCFEMNGSERDFTSEKAFRTHLRWHKLFEPLFTCEILWSSQRMGEKFKKSYAITQASV